MSEEHIHEHDIQFKRLDFSQFHATSDHWPFTKWCRTFYPFGWKSGFHHMSLAWEFHRREQALTPLYWILCRINRHAWQTCYIIGTEDYETRCIYCRAERETKPEERFYAPR